MRIDKVEFQDALTPSFFPSSEDILSQIAKNSPLCFVGYTDGEPVWEFINWVGIRGDGRLLDLVAYRLENHIRSETSSLIIEALHTRRPLGMTVVNEPVPRMITGSEIVLSTISGEIGPSHGWHPYISPNATLSMRIEDWHLHRDCRILKNDGTSFIMFRSVLSKSVPEPKIWVTFT
jgi:hypothetical protein